MKVADRAFNNLVSPIDVRDFKIAAAKRNFPATFVLPEVTVKNQGSVGSCVAHACSSVVEFHNKRQEGTDIVFSTEFIYGYRPTGYYVGEGMYIRDALKTLRKVGDCTKAELTGNHTYEEAIDAVEANLDELKDRAYPHRISTYAKVKTIEEIKTALMDFGYVVVSMTWHTDYKLVNGVYTYTSNKTRGNHCVIIYGWDERGWLVHNSWGIGWGQKGKFVVPFDFKWREAWAVTDSVVGELDIVRPADNWFIRTFSPILNKFANWFWSIVNKFKKN